MYEGYGMIGMQAFRPHGIPEAVAGHGLLPVREIHVVGEQECIRQADSLPHIGPFLIQHGKCMFCHEPFKAAFPDEDPLCSLAELTPAGDVDDLFYQGCSTPENFTVFGPAGSPQMTR
jgi:hypothetical protein